MCLFVLAHKIYAFKQQYQQQELQNLKSIKTDMRVNQPQVQANAQQSTTSIVNFIPLDKIGQGSFSSVYKVRRITDDQIYALKKIKIAALKQKQRQNALNQIRILASINSQYIVQYREAFFDHKLNLLCIVMQFANEGDLQKKIQNFRRSMRHFPENQIWKAAYHTIKGLDILHTKSILHRDIKSANIFINNGVYKLGDLNVSKVQDNVNKLAYTQTGTPYYASPQVWRDEPYDNKSDIWSLGCVLYEMCTFRPPFKGKNLQQLYHNVQKGTYDELPIVYSQQLSNFIGLCLRLNPKNRLSCKQLLSSNTLQKKCYELNMKFQNNDLNEQLLKTIKLPNDLKDLKKKLPKSKYSCSIDHIGYKKSMNQQCQRDFCKCSAQKVNDCVCKKHGNQLINPIKKYSHADYYLQMARKKKQIQIANSNYTKINRVISEGSLNKNPEQDNALNMGYKITNNAESSRNLHASTKNKNSMKNSSSKLMLQQNKCLQVRSKNRQYSKQNLKQKQAQLLGALEKERQRLILFSDRVRQDEMKKIGQNNHSKQYLKVNYPYISQEQNKASSDQNKNKKYHINISKNMKNEQSQMQQQKMRKLSHDQQTPKSNKIILNHLSLIKKLSNSTVSKCLSHRNLQLQSQKQKQKQKQKYRQKQDGKLNQKWRENYPNCKNIKNNIQNYSISQVQSNMQSVVQTQRQLFQEKKTKNIPISKRNQQLAQIEKKVEQKRKQLRKIGSIQRLQAANNKNIHNLSYRPNLVLNSHIKKSAIHISNILLKSPTSTEDQPSNINPKCKQKQKQRANSHKRLMISPQINKVSSTPYMMGLSDAPRMKRIMENLNDAKKTRQLQIKNKLFNNRYHLSKY